MRRTFPLESLPGAALTSIAHGLGTSDIQALRRVSRALGAHFTPDSPSMRERYANSLNAQPKTILQDALQGGQFLRATEEIRRLCRNNRRVLDEIMKGVPCISVAVVKRLARTHGPTYLWSTLRAMLPDDAYVAIVRTSCRGWSDLPLTHWRHVLDFVPKSGWVHVALCMYATRMLHASYDMDDHLEFIPRARAIMRMAPSEKESLEFLTQLWLKGLFEVCSDDIVDQARDDGFGTTAYFTETTGPALIPDDRMRLAFLRDLLSRAITTPRLPRVLIHQIFFFHSIPENVWTPTLLNTYLRSSRCISDIAQGVFCAFDSSVWRRTTDATLRTMMRLLVRRGRRMIDAISGCIDSLIDDVPKIRLHKALETATKTSPQSG